MMGSKLIMRSLRGWWGKYKLFNRRDGLLIKSQKRYYRYVLFNLKKQASVTIYKII